MNEQHTPVTNLDGKTALVTGAGRGIGRAVALGLSAAGAAVIAIARSTDQLEDMASAAVGRTPRLFAADLTDPTHISNLTEVIANGDGVDILVNNAATVGPLGPSEQASLDEIATAFSLNALAPAALAAAILPRMRAKGWGRIVNVSSRVAGDPAAMIGGNTYVATKAALEAHTLNLAAELESTGVTANVYRPGVVDTGMQSWVRDRDPDRIGRSLHNRFARYKADGVLLTPETSAAALLRRLADSATGQIWDVADPDPHEMAE